MMTDVFWILDAAVNEVRGLRSRLGSIAGRLFDVNLKALNVAFEELSASASSLGDADPAQELAQALRNRLVRESGILVLGQANINARQALRLLSEPFYCGRSSPPSVVSAHTARMAPLEPARKMRPRESIAAARTTSAVLGSLTSSWRTAPVPPNVRSGAPSSVNRQATMDRLDFEQNPPIRIRNRSRSPCTAAVNPGRVSEESTGVKETP